MSNNDDQKTTRSGNGASGPEDEAQWDDRTKDYGPGYIDKVAEKLNEASAGGWDENRTVEVSTLPGVPPPVLADEVPTEAEADRPPPSASLGDASTNEFEVSAPAPPEFGGQTMLDLDASAAMERIDSARREAADAAPNAGEFSETTLIDPGALESGEGDPGDAPRKPVSAKPGASDDPFELADASYLEEEADPFKASGARKTTIPEVIPSEKSGVSQLTQDDAARIAVTDEVSVSALPAAKEESSSTESAASADSEAHTRDDLQAGSSPPKRVEEESTEAEEGDESKADSFVDSADEPPLQTLNPIPVSHDTDAVPQIDAMSTPQPTEEVEHSLGTQDISILSNADSVAADLQDVPPADGTEEVDPPGAGPKGTLVLEVEASVSQEVDPAMLPPAFPNTTGDVKSISGEMPPPPPSPDLREAMNGPGEDDAWAGYDDTGGWHTLTGESQVVMSESSQRSEPKPPAPEPHSQVSSSAVFDSSQPSAAEERAQLIGIQGADTGRQHSITGDEVLIGRSSRCSIVLAEPSVSRQHARIERRDDGFWVVDLDSGNGTYVNGQRVGEFRVFSGDEVTFGNGTFQFLETAERFEPVDASAAPVRAESPRAVARAPSVAARPVALLAVSIVMLV
ncbi:MAG: FHA domain-containing protein, partial [Myxococcota bacterium]